MPPTSTSGDLPPNVNIIQDGAAGGDDEGRAMAREHLPHRPGGGSRVRDRVRQRPGRSPITSQALANTAEAKIIVDDVGYADDPFFQPGLITQAINTVTAQGVTYFSVGRQRGRPRLPLELPAAHRHGHRRGHRHVHELRSHGGTTLLLPITVNVANTQHRLPVRPALGHPGAGRFATGRRPQVNFYVLDATGNVIASGTNNNVATQEPQQFVTVPTTGSYFVAIQVVSGSQSRARRVRPVRPAVDQRPDRLPAIRQRRRHVLSRPRSATTPRPTRSAWVPCPGGRRRPTWARTRWPPSRSARPGPADPGLQCQRHALTSPLTVQNPTITAPDGGNTTFFGFVADISNTSQPAVHPGQPRTSTPPSLPTGNLPSFFGTSSAAPNAAAIAALMLQKVPGATPAQIKAALIASAATTPMNGIAPPGHGTRRPASA